MKKKSWNWFLVGLAGFNVIGSWGWMYKYKWFGTLGWIGMFFAVLVIAISEQIEEIK